MGKAGIHFPKTAIDDRGRASMNALKEVFGDRIISSGLWTLLLALHPPTVTLLTRYRTVKVYGSECRAVEPEDRRDVNCIP
jgi:hypothetical protein